MRRSVQVGIAVLVLSIRLWNKLFFVSEYLGKGGVMEYATKENFSRAMLAFFLMYYIVIKVVQ